VLASHPNLALHLAGHEHSWLDYLDYYGFPHVMVAATRYDADNYWLLELDSKGHYKFLDYDKTTPLHNCSETWSYDGTPRRVEPQPDEDGDC
jgi:hypothetical protein